MKSKIKEIKEVKEWDGGKGTILYHSLIMENEDKIQIGKKNRLEVGQEIEYEIDSDSQQEYKKAKTPFNKTPALTGDNLKGIKIGHAITNAVNLHIAQGSASENQNIKDSIKTYAGMIYQLSEELNNEI